MVQTLKRQCRVLWRDWLALCVGIVWGMGIFGFVLYQILLVFAEDTGAYVPLGTILAAFTGAIFAATLTITQMGLYFNVEVSMGCIRKHFFLSYTVCVCAASLFAAGMVILFCMAENALNGACLLYTSGIVTCTKEGKRSIYSINRKRLAQISESIMKWS